MAATVGKIILTLIGCAFLLGPGNDFQWTNGRLVGGQDLCVYVSCLESLQKDKPQLA
jgi:hypothetical protein